MLKFLIGWAIFVAVVYLLLWFDTIFFRKDVPQKFRDLMESFSEED